jgi:hypothetical protein
MKYGSKLILMLVFAMVMLGITGVCAFGQDKPDYQKHMDWAANDTGSVDCPQFYGNNLDCLAFGGRSCVMTKAIIAAKNGYDQYAYAQVLLTQCHNPGAEQTLVWAGQQAVADYLRSF